MIFILWMTQARFIPPNPTVKSARKMLTLGVGGASVPNRFKESSSKEGFSIPQTPRRQEYNGTWENSALL